MTSPAAAGHLSSDRFDTAPLHLADPHDGDMLGVEPEGGSSR